MSTFRTWVFNKAIDLNWWGRSNIVIFKKIFFFYRIVPCNLQSWLGYFKGELGGEISFAWQPIIPGGTVFTFCWITPVHSSYWIAKDIFKLNLGNHMLIMSPFCVLACGKECGNALFCVIFFLLTVLIHCRRQCENNSMRLTDNCRCIYTDSLILACCLEIQLEVMQYASK